MIEVDDFVIIKKPVNDIKYNSVGIVYTIDTLNKMANVFFIGQQVNIVLSFNNIEFLDVTKTGKPYEYKICNVCHILKKDFEHFDINQTDAKGRKTTRPSCIECRKDIDGTPLKTRERNRLIAIKPKHFFICPICNKGSIAGVTANLVIDHDHVSGNAREWICDSCNTGLGRFKDNIVLLEKAIEYLKRHENI